ncbi:double-stranded RNA-binding protein 6-like [Phragmites australis]|uniref:double-stranded RNA-binding protein 6-like n=1 Tax=Phragmites australis TaxID=29695 RepID=UPI002D77171C|nr:double-stranded RNA-binding protein 6-like [Phragmites australis]
MYKNQLQELAQRSCFNLPAYTCLREGPDHAPRFKAAVNFNGEQFESPGFCTTLRQAEHAAAEVALAALACRGPSYSLAARILDETGVYKNLLQEVAQRVGAPLPSYTTERSGLGHLPVFTCTVELAGITFTGDPAKNKKQAEKNAASAAWSSLKQLVRQEANSSNELENNDEQEQIRIARALLNYRLKEKMAMANYPHASPFPKKFPMQPERKPSFAQSSQSSYSKILPLFRPKSNSRFRSESPASTDGVSQSPAWTIESLNPRSRFPAAEAAPYVPVGHYRIPCHSMAPSVTIRTAVPVFSAPPLPPPAACTQQLPPLMSHTPPIRMASPVRIRPASGPMFAPSAPVQGPKPVIPVELKDVQQRTLKESVSPVIPVQVKDVQYQPMKESMSPMISVQVKDAQRQPLTGSLSPVIPIQMKDVQSQSLKETPSLGKGAPLAAPFPATRPLVKIEGPAQAKEASKLVTSEVSGSAAGNTAAVECTTASDFLPTRQLRAGDADDGKAEAEHEAEAQAVAEAAIRQLDIN